MFKAHKLLCHSTLGFRVTKKKMKKKPATHPTLQTYTPKLGGGPRRTRSRLKSCSLESYSLQPQILQPEIPIPAA